MREVQFSRGRGSWGGRLFLLGAVALVIVGITQLDKIKAIIMPKPAPVARQPLQPRKGEILVPVSVRPLEAYKRIRADGVTLARIPKAQLEGTDVITSMADVLSRVPRINIEPNSLFRIKSLLPKEAPEGYSGAIPENWVGMKLDRAQLDGQLDGLHPGDYVALYTPNAKWVCQKAIVLLPYKQNVTHPGAGAPSAKDIMGRDVPTAPGAPVVTGDMTITLPAQDSMTLNQVLANKEHVRMLMLGSASQTLDIPPVDQTAKEAPRPAIQQVIQMDHGKQKTIKVQSAPVEQVGTGG